MNFFHYYLFANAYILVFWVFFILVLKKQTNFQSLRIYLNLALVLALLLPILQNGISSLLSSSSLVLDSNVHKLPAIGFIYKYEESFAQTGTSAFSFQNITGSLILLGSLLTSLFYLVNHFKISSILRRSVEQHFPDIKLRVAKSEEVSVPFIYNNCIVLPAAISSNELSLAIKHESLHYKYRHDLDNLLFSFCHILFWANPFFLLLRASLKLNHEYQVDGQMLSSGVDPTFYKLSLIRYSVGLQKFSLANEMSSTNIKNRLVMINNKHLQSGKWRIFLLIPMITILLAVFCLACVQNEGRMELAEIPVIENSRDSVMMEIIDVTDLNPQDLKEGVLIVVLMNRNSKLLIAGEKVPIENAEERIISEYKRLADNGRRTRVVVQKDAQADMVEFQKLLDMIAMAHYRARAIYANRLFESNFDLLSLSEKEQIIELVPYEIYRVFPDKDIRSRTASSQ